MARLTCRSCEEVFEKVGRGRNPTRCPTCRAQEKVVKQTQRELAEPKVSSTERVDRLEILLKAQGTHISQHQKDY